MSRPNLTRVFCLEAPWSDRLTDRSSVRPLLDLLESRGEIRYAHRTASSVDEFLRSLRQWTQARYERFGFGYLATHGERGTVRVGQALVPLETLKDELRGRLAGRVLYFGSCETMRISLDQAQEFRRVTRARAVCGYTTEIDWVEAAAFELNLLYSVGHYDRIDAGFRYLDKHHGDTCRHLDLRAVWNGGELWSPT